jgi:molecular chaperone DnaJ
MKDYYKILEVGENATPDEIKKSYRKMSKQFHPDVNPNGDERFKEIGEAYEILSDENKRRNYDAQRKNPFSGGMNFGDMDINDLFNSLFGGATPKRAPKINKEIVVSVGVLETYTGVDKKITYLRNVACSSCSGQGGDKQKCNGCNGVGVKTVRTGNGFFSQMVQRKCGECSGLGYKITNPCFSCSGSGGKVQTDNITITLPKGVVNGNMFKFNGYGDYKSGQYGDLIIKLQVVPQNNFDRVENDLIYTQYFDIDDLKKEKIQIPHPDGELTVTLPQLFDSSIPLKVNGKGFPGGNLLIKQVVKFDKEVFKQNNITVDSGT